MSAAEPKKGCWGAWWDRVKARGTAWCNELTSAQNPFLKKIWIFLYGHAVLLFIQVWAGFVGASVYAWKTRTGPHSGLKTALGISLSFSGWYCFTVCIIVLLEAPLRAKLKKPNLCWKTVLYIVRVLAVVGLIRVFVIISDVLGANSKDLNGYSVAFFLLSYLHVVSIAKLFAIEDYICLADSLLAIAILISSRLEVIEPSKNIGRTFATYFCSVLLVAFRFSEVPYGEDDKNAAANAAANAAEDAA